MERNIPKNNTGNRFLKRFSSLTQPKGQMAFDSPGTCPYDEIDFNPVFFPFPQAEAVVGPDRILQHSPSRFLVRASPKVVARGNYYLLMSFLSRP